MSHGVTEKDTGWMFQRNAWHQLFEVGQKRIKTLRDFRKVIPWDVKSVPFITLPQLEKVAVSFHAAGAPNSARKLVAQASEFASPDYRAIVRTDTLDVLGVWTEQGEPITNERGYQFMQALLGETSFEALFSIEGGRKVCMLSVFPDWIEVGGDKVGNYLYSRLDHTGSGAMQTMVTPIRVQCANTDRFALSEAKLRDGIFKVRHIGDIDKHLEVAAREALNLSVDYPKQFKRFGDRLAKQKIAERKLAAVVDELWPPASDGTRAMKSAQDRKDLIAAIFRGDTSHAKVSKDTTGNAPGTKWCALNSIVEYQQHYSPTRIAQDTADPGRARAERLFIRATDDPAGIRDRAVDLIAAA
jgi:phage/plasmid-like protein (TIGR03299 family)